MISITRTMARALLFALTLLALLWGASAQAQNNAAFIGQNVPTSMLTGATTKVVVTMRNTGSTTWSAANAVFLGSQNPENNSTWGGGRVAMPASIEPTGKATLFFQITAPNTPGTYNFQWRMLQEGVEWFGPATPNVAITVTAAPPHNDAQVIGVSVPAVMTQGQGYTVGVTVKNSGNTTWPAGTAYALGSTIPQNTMLWGVKRASLASAVAPGQQTTFSFQVTAPAAGTYSMGWGMVQENVEWFGASSSSAVTVNAAAAGEVVTYIHTDGLGSPVARTDGAGNVVSRTRYEPYGLTAGGATPTIGFTGHVNDADTGLVYMQQRYYDPVAGRFLSIDPVTTDANTGGSFNRYVYADNNPYKNVDPDGRNAVLALARVGMTSYRIANFFGAGRLGSAIGIGIYNATHTDKPSVLTPGEENHIINGDNKGGGHSSGLGLPGKSEFPPGWTNDKIVGEISDVLTDPSSTTKPGRDGATIIEGTRDCVLIRCVVGPNGEVLTGYPVKGPGVTQNPKPKPPEKPPAPPKPEPKT